MPESRTAGETIAENCDHRTAWTPETYGQVLERACSACIDAALFVQQLELGGSPPPGGSAIQRLVAQAEEIARLTEARTLAQAEVVALTERVAKLTETLVLARPVIEVTGGTFILRRLDEALAAEAPHTPEKA